MENKITTNGMDIIVYLGIVISLATSVFNFISIIFSIINFKFSELAVGYDIYGDSTRMAIAYLIVMFPIYLALSLYSVKVVRDNKERENSKPRRFTIFASLFITALTLIGALISTVYTYLGGELSTSFALKVLTVVIVAILLGGYYFYSLLFGAENKNYALQIFSVIATFIVLISIISSIYIFGTPSELRDKKFDNQRLSDISSIQNQILSYWQTYKALPDELSKLNNPLIGFFVPSDPQTKASYKYKIIKQSDLAYEAGKSYPTDAKFEICAKFITERKIATSTQDVDAKIFVQPTGFYFNSYDRTPFWNHGIGEGCFEREIKKESFNGK